MTTLTTMNISLPVPMKAFVDQRVDQGDYSTSSEYVRELIRKDHDLAKLREALLVGATSELMVETNEEFFEKARKYVNKRAKELGR
jgi:antitoxin ParD1/3/4